MCNVRAQGYAASERGEHRDSNPYEEYSEGWFEWDAGWLAAECESGYLYGDGATFLDEDELDLLCDSAW